MSSGMLCAFYLQGLTQNVMPMEDNQARDPLIERRFYKESSDQMWSSLTIAQKFSASSLAKYGYELAFIRHSAAGNLAVLMLDDKVTTVSNDGQIDTAPNISIR